MKKRILALALCVITLFCALPLTAMADATNVVEDSILLDYLISEGYDLDDNGAISASEMADVAYIDVSGLGVTSLEGLQYAPYIFWLDASKNNISDISPLEGLSELWVVDLSFNSISGTVDFAQLGWYYAENITLSHNVIESVQGIESLEWATFLDLSYNRLSDITELLGLTALETLLINNNCYSLNPSDADFGCFEQIASENANMFDYVYAPQLVGGITEDFILDITDAALLEALIANGVDVTVDGKISACELGNVYTKLNLSGYGIKDISALSFAVNTPAIDLGENEITSVNALAGLTQLEALDLSDNKLESIDALSAITSLTDLDLAGNKISDIGAIAGMTALVNLDLSRNDISDASALSALVNLKVLSLSDNFISAIELSASFDKIDLSYNIFTSVADLVKIKAGTFDITYNNLVASEISPADFADVSVLVYETQTEYDGSHRDVVYIPDTVLLEILLGQKFINTNGDSVITKGELAGYSDALDLSGTGVTDITGLRYMKRLDVFRLDNTAVSDISEMAYMTKLRIFTAANSSVDSIAPLKNLERLEYITVPNTSVSDISALQSNTLYALKSINLAGNGITDASALGNIPTLKTITLSSNKISDIGFIDSLTAPEYLYLDNNEIEDVDVIYNATTLVELDVSSNFIDIPADFRRAMYANNAKLVLLRYDNQQRRVLVDIVIDVAGDDFFELEINGEYMDLQNDYRDTLDAGAVFVVRALPEEGEFLYWKIDTGKIVSYDEEYTFIASSKTRLTAVFRNRYSGGNYVSFYTDSNQELYTRFHSFSAGIQELPEFALPENPGFEFIGWSIDGKTAIAQENLIAAITEALPNGDVNLYPLYVSLDDYHTVTVINGTGGGRYVGSSVINVTADEPAEGMKFAYWVDGDGQIVSYNTVYTLAVTRDVTLEAVYVDADEEIEAQAAIAITDKSSDPAAKTVTFVVTRDVPTKYTIVQTGIILTSDATIGEDEDAFVIDAAGTIKGTSASKENKGAYVVSKSRVEVGDTWYARGYVVYLDTNGELVYCYSAIDSITA